MSINLSRYANFPYRNEQPRARGGIEEQGIHIEHLPLGTQLFRFSGCPTMTLPDPNAFKHVAAYDAAMARYRKLTSKVALEALTKGCWWSKPKFINDMKWQSVERNVSIGGIARVASAVKFEWSQMDHFLTAEVKTPQGLFAFCGRGRDMTEEIEVDGARVKIKLVADPNIDQLYIPGLWLAQNVTNWLKILDVQYIGSHSRQEVLRHFGDGSGNLRRH